MYRSILGDRPGGSGSNPKTWTNGRFTVDEMMVVTCRVCRAWYSMDFEPAIDSEHFDMRTGELCPNNDDNDWMIISVPYREDWEVAY